MSLSIPQHNNIEVLTTINVFNLCYDVLPYVTLLPGGQDDKRDGIMKVSCHGLRVVMTVRDAKITPCMFYHS